MYPSLFLSVRCFGTIVKDCDARDICAIRLQLVTISPEALRPGPDEGDTSQTEEPELSLVVSTYAALDRLLGF
jgi:hypothetical protein